MRLKNRSYFAIGLAWAILAVLVAGVPAAAQIKNPSGPVLVLGSGSGSESFLGVNVVDMDQGRANMLNLKDVHGVEITQVAPGSPAGQAGLKPRDVVLEYQGQRVEGRQQFQRLVQETPVGRRVKMTVFRNGSPQTITADIGTRPNQFAKALDPLPDMQDMNVWIPDVPRPFTSWRSVTLGVEAEAIDGQLASYFGVDHGTLVRSVIQGSAADKAGIRAGDVILKVDGQDVSSPRELSMALRTSRTKKNATLGVMRDRKPIDVTVALDDGGSGSILPLTRAIRGPA